MEGHDTADDEDIDSDEDNDSDESSAEINVEEDVPLPSWDPEDGLGDVLRMEDVSDSFGIEARRFIQHRPGRGFALRLHGGAVGDDQIDSLVLSDLLRRWGRATAWFTNSLFGFRHVPGVNFAGAVRSVVVQFAAPEYEDKLPGRGPVATPTAVTGHWMASLLRAEEDEIFSAAEILRPRATQSYLRALEEVAQHEVSIDWLLLDGRRPRVLETSRGEIVDTIDLLGQPVKTRDRTVSVIGILYSADQYRRRFRMDVQEGELAGRTITGSYGLEADSSLEDAWRKRVDATIAITEPVKAGLPRSPRTNFRLVRINRIRFGEQVPLEPHLLPRV